jgi:hypothetical protein
LVKSTLLGGGISAQCWPRIVATLVDFLKLSLGILFLQIPIGFLHANLLGLDSRPDDRFASTAANDRIVDFGRARRLRGRY